MVDVDGSILLVDSQTKSVGLVWGCGHLALSLHSPNDMGELSMTAPQTCH